MSKPRASTAPPAGVSARASIPPLPMWALVCFFASGMAGLLYEIVWSKQLAYLLGSSLHSVATVVACFLGGLALGARVIGVPLSRKGDGAVNYARLEVGIAMLGVALLPVLHLLDPVFGSLYRSLGGESAAFALARFALLAIVLVPPAAMMGATLPVLVEHFEHDRVGPQLARLYALNTFGAVAGSLLGGFVLLPGIGLALTTGVAAALNLTAAFLAWWASRAAPARARERAAAAAGAGATGAAAGAAAEAGAAGRARVRAHAVATPVPDALTGGWFVVFAGLFALSGFAALVFQIAWVRLFGLVFGSSVYSFSAVLGVYLFGLATGAALVARALRGRVTLAHFAALQLAIGVACAAMLHAFGRLTQWTYDLAARSGTDWGALFVGELGIVAALLLIPCMLFGAIFPVAARLLQRGDGGHAAGFAYAVNTLGTIAGSLLAGFVLIPTWGVQGTHTGALALSLALGAAALAMAAARREVKPTAGLASLGALAAGAVIAFAAPAWNPSVMSAGSYRPSQAANLARYAQFVGGAGTLLDRASRLETVLYYREGINGSVLVGTDPQGTERWLRVGGKIDASTQDMGTQLLLGLIPAALADSGARTLVVGLGSGATVAAALAAGAGRTDVIELEPGVVEASRFFYPRGQGPLDDPRVRLRLGDARTHIQHAAERYGMIVSQPSNPWIAGINNLFTVDFYRRVRERLEPDGVFCQWMQLYELSPETFDSMMRSFLEVFPEGQAFCVWDQVDLLLIAAPRDATLDLARLSSGEARATLAVAGIGSPEEVAGFWGGPLDSLRGRVGDAPLNHDDRPVVEYRAPRDLVAVGRSAAGRDPRVVAAVPFEPGKPGGALFAGWPDEAWYEGRVRTLASHGEALRAVMSVASARAAGFGDLAARLGRELDARDRRRRANELLARADELRALGRRDEARSVLASAAATDSSHALVWLRLADQQRLAKEFGAATASLAQARAAAGGDSAMRTDAAMIGGMVELDRSALVAGATLFAEAQRWNPKLAMAYALEARARLAAGDASGARTAVERGLMAVPGDATLVGLAGELGRP